MVKGIEKEFRNGSEIALFDPSDLDSMMALIDYYLEHEDEREQIRCFPLSAMQCLLVLCDVYS